MSHPIFEFLSAVAVPRGFVFSTAAAAALCATSCDGDPALPGPSYALDDVIVHADTIRLEESEGIVLVAPFFSYTEEGYILVADASEAKIHLFDRDGSLLETVGRRGRGPGEFTAPVTAALLGRDTLIVGDLADGVSVLSLAGDSLYHLEAATVQRPYQIRTMGNRVLVAGRTAPEEGYDADLGSTVLHLLDRSTLQKKESVIALDYDPLLEPLLRSFGAAVLAENRGRITVAFSLFDTLYTWDPEEKFARRQQISIGPLLPEQFLREGPPSGLSIDRAELVTLVRRIEGLHVLEDGRFLIQTLSKPTPQTFHRTLFLLGPDRNVSWRIDNSPRLLAGRGDTVLLSDPASPTPESVVEVLVR